MLDQKAHKLQLINILLKLYRNSQVGSVLGFKGGTAAFLFYNLPRFSVDLDFDLLRKLDKTEQENLIDKISELLSKDYVIRQRYNKRYTLFWLVSYKKGERQIKIEISKRLSKSKFVNRNLYGASMAVMVWPDMVANKLMALIDRRKLANRDVFDAHFFLSQPEAVKINYQLVEQRLKLKPKQLYKKALSRIQKKRKRSWLYGMGELLDKNQKIWVKQKMVEELIELIKMQLDLL